jgi:hypothetical protein
MRNSADSGAYTIPFGLLFRFFLQLLMYSITYEIQYNFVKDFLLLVEYLNYLLLDRPVRSMAFCSSVFWDVAHLISLS